LRLQTKITLLVEKHTTQHNRSFPRSRTSSSAHLRWTQPTETGSHRLYTG